MDRTTALVVHPDFTQYGGGEMVCLHVIRALQDLNYHVECNNAFSDWGRIMASQIGASANILALVVYKYLCESCLESR